MITITERAKKELKTVLIAADAGPDEGLRLLPSPDGGCALALGTELSGDLVIEHEGCKVLLIGIEYFRILDGKTIDCLDTEHGAILLVR